jgi:Zn-finger nucleic acid-binding protein|tara:strand:- start:913 stop:1287 length:375 start_codon:yes stop_codon:yes gene_type:complete
MLEESIICPNCGANIEEMDLREKLVCPHCKKDLKDRNYLDFLEYLMANGIVENLDFFDASVYSEDIERFDPEDEDDVDVTEHEKRKEVFNLYENEMVQQQEEEEQVNYKDFDGLDEDWEDFNSA